MCVCVCVCVCVCFMLPEDKCPALPPPKNGALSCYLGDMGWDCHLACEAAYDVPFKSYAWFVCPNERRFWSPSHVPDCIGM